MMSVLPSMSQKWPHRWNAISRGGLSGDDLNLWILIGSPNVCKRDVLEASIGEKKNEIKGNRGNMKKIVIKQMGFVPEVVKLRSIPYIYACFPCIENPLELAFKRAILVSCWPLRSLKRGRYLFHSICQNLVTKSKVFFLRRTTVALSRPQPLYIFSF